MLRHIGINYIKMPIKVYENVKVRFWIIIVIYYGVTIKSNCVSDLIKIT